MPRLAKHTPIVSSRRSRAFAITGSGTSSNSRPAANSDSSRDRLVERSRIRASVCLGTGIPHDFAPLDGFRLDESRKVLPRVAHWCECEGCKTVLHFLLIDDLDDFRIELVEDSRRCLGGSGDSDPPKGLEPGESLFRDCRQLRQECRAFLRRDTEAHQLSCLDLRP